MQNRYQTFFFLVRFYLITPFCSKYFVQDCRPFMWQLDADHLCETYAKLYFDAKHLKKIELGVVKTLMPFFNWIGALTLSLLLKLPPRKL